MKLTGPVLALALALTACGDGDSPAKTFIKMTAALERGDAAALEALYSRGGRLMVQSTLSLHMMQKDDQTFEQQFGVRKPEDPPKGLDAFMFLMNSKGKYLLAPPTGSKISRTESLGDERVVYYEDPRGGTCKFAFTSTGDGWRAAGTGCLRLGDGADDKSGD